MSINELTSYGLPKYGKQLQHRLVQPLRTSRKSLRRAAKRQQRAVRAYFARQYYLTSAFADIKSAASRNEDILLGSLLLTGMVAFGFSVLAAQAVLSVMTNLVDFSDKQGAPLFNLLLIAIVSFACISLWLSAFFTNAHAIAIMEGATRKQLKSLRSTVRRALGAAGRISVAWLLLAAIVAIPAGAVLIVSSLVIMLAGSQALIPSTICAAVIASGWVLYALSSFSLAGQVALFEPKIPVLQTLNRSRDLVARRGRLFVLATYLLLAICIAVSELLNLLAKKAGLSTDAILYIGVFASMLLTSSLKTALYRRRKLARNS